MCVLMVQIGHVRMHVFALVMLVFVHVPTREPALVIVIVVPVVVRVLVTMHLRRMTMRVFMAAAQHQANAHKAS